ncbi:MAG TPA: histidine kinase, partial [Steroidobacteraceae bacterium]|nr:histidine kinase [Steroidobacteraceae bacterium]
MLIVELTAILLALARQGGMHGAARDFWADLARTSLFLLWVGLICAALLCWTRRSLERLTVARGSAAVLVLLTATIAAISAAAYLIGRSQLAIGAGAAAFFPAALPPFVLRNVAIGFLIIAVALRYFYVTHQWRRNIEMRAAAQVHALQARIRPHFLFNSMNTIASLTRSDPVLAEQAVQDLADLFRASLSDQRQTITLAEELEVAHTYQRIEELRLGPRLRVQWDVERLPADARVPGLLLQPLLENAIYHGIEPRPEGGTVGIV